MTNSISKSELYISVLTFNIWGLPGWIAKNKDDRIKAIGQVLSEMTDVDVISLQEVWIESDYQLLKSALMKMFPYSHYFYSGVTGSGVCAFSKWPIKEILFHQWPLNGYIHMIHHGDWFGGKGVGLVVLDVAGYRVNIYTTHLHAQYHEDDSYLAHRVEQAFDTAMFIRLTSANAHFSVLAGDLNTPPGSLCEQLLIHVGQLSDAYNAHDNDSSGGTNDCCRNSYSNPSLVLTNPDGLRIDYILFKSSLSTQSELISYKFPLERRVPDKDYSYSDHEAVLATFRLNNTINETPKKMDVNAIEKALALSISICSTALGDTNKKSTFYWTLAATLFCILLFTPLIFENLFFHSLKEWIIFFLLVILIIILLVFSVMMATIWSKLEFNGILGVRDRMIALSDALKKTN